MASLPNQCKAWVWHGNQFPSDLKLKSVPIPTLHSDDVLVQNQAIGLNPVDWKVLDMKTGSVPGVDGAGVVVAVGENVSTSLIGLRVDYHQDLRRSGSFAEYTPIKATTLIPLPETMDYATAASIPCPALTAWQALEKIPVKPNRTLLISGAGGSVGHYLTQLAAARGFIVSVLANPRHREHLTALGAHHFLDNRQWCELLQQEPNFYAVIDAVSPERAYELAPLVTANGHLVAIQGRTEQWPTQPFSQAISLHEVALGALHQYGNDSDWQELTNAGKHLLRHIASGQLRAEQIHISGFTELAQKLDALKNRNFTGKLIITTHSD